MTTEQLALVDQLLIEGKATRTINILNNKATIILESLTASAQIEVEKQMRAVDGTPAFVVHTYSVKLLSVVLKGYQINGKEKLVFETPADAEHFILSRPSTLVDAMMAAHTKFEKELEALTKEEGLEENFTPTPLEDSTQN